MVDKALAAKASFGDDTLSQREAAVRLFDEQEGFTEANENLKPARPTRTAKKDNEAVFPVRTSISKEEAIARGLKSTEIEPEGTDDVRMQDGFIVRGVPKSASKADIYEIYNKANGFSTVKGFDPGVLQKTGDFMSDVGKVMRMNFDETRVGALTRALFEEDQGLAPRYDSNGSFQGFRKMSKKETSQQRELASEAYARAINAPEDDTAAGLTGRALNQIIDPANLAVLAVGGVPNTTARFMSIFGAEATLGGVGEIAEQTNQGVDVSDVDKNRVLWRAGLQGITVAGADKAIGFWQVARIAAKGSDKALNKSLDILQDEVTKNRRLGWDPKPAIVRAMETTGQTFKSVRKATDKLNRSVDLTGQKLTLLPNKIKRVTGIDKIHVPKALEKIVTPLSSVIRDISARVFGRLRKHDFGVAQREGTAYAEVQNFLARGQKGARSRQFIDTALKKEAARLDRALTPKERVNIIETTKASRIDVVPRTLNAAGIRATGLRGEVKLLNGRVVSAEDHLKGLVLSGDARQVKKLGQDINDPLLYPAYLRARKQLDAIQKEMIDVGLLDKGLKDFWPRIVKDVDGLKAALGKKHLTSIETAIQKAKDKKGAPLDSTEMSAIINRFVTGKQREITPGRKIKSQRTIDVIPSRLLPFYDSLNGSLVRYIDDTAKMIERKKFFGDFSNKGKTITNSISDVLNAEVKRGHMLAKDIPQLHSLLESRFVHGAQGPGKLTQNVRNIFYASTLGQFTNAATQIADLGIGSFVNGLGNTVRQLSKANRRVLPEDFNLTRKIAEDFSGTEGTAKALSNILHTTGFKFIDRMGKTANMNAAILKAEKQVLSAKGLQAFRKEWAPIYGKDTNALIKDLQAKKVTDNVKLLAFNKLADVQPISLSEMPQNYLNMTNGRILYALNTFTIKQLDLMRRRAVREMIHGNSLKGATELTRFGMMFGAANMGVADIKDWMRGRDRPIDDKVLDAMYKNFGTSEYIVDRGMGGQAQQAVVNSLMPIASILDTGAQSIETIAALVKGDEDWGRRMHLLSNKIPLGQFFYDWFGGGIEEYRERQETEQEREDFGLDDEDEL